MTVKQLAVLCAFEIEVGGTALEKTVTGGYCGDLLSWVMGRAQDGSAWVTIMGNENAVAVAVLADVACIVLVEGAALDEKAAARAKENGVAVLKSAMPAFAASIAISNALGSAHAGEIAGEPCA